MRFHYPAVITALLAACAAPAWAADSAAGPAPGASTVEEIVVTGEKTDRPLQKTVTSVRVVTAKDIDDENLITAFDVIDRTANLNSNQGRTGFTIRGIANDNVTGAGTGDLATVYLDGSPLPKVAFAGPLDLWDLTQVEVLRGPQSTLEGRNTLAGAIILKTADPTYDWTGAARVILTDQDGERRYSAAIGGPILADQIAFRIAGETSNAKGLITNPTRGDDHAGFQTSDTVRGKLLFTPAALPRLRVVASYMHDRHAHGATYSFTDLPDAWDDRITLGNRLTEVKVSSDIAALNIAYELSPALNLSSVSTYSRIRSSSVYDGDDVAVDSEYGDFSQNQKTFSQEVRLNLDSGPFSGLLGAYYSHLDNTHDLADSTFELNPVTDLGLPGAVSGFYPAELVINTSQFYPQTVRTAAVFGDGSWKIAPRLSLNAGFRYDNEHQVRANNNTVTLATALPNPALFGPYAATIAYVNGLIAQQLAAANASSPPTPTTFKAFLPKGGITYDLSDDASISATVQRGYRSGGSGVNAGRGQLYTYKPEYTWNYEVALRSLWLGGRLAVNANAFYIDWKDQQVTVQLSSNIYDYDTENAGSSRVYGFELENRFRASRAVSLYSSIGYANTRFDDFTLSSGTQADLSGHQFPFAPRWTVAAGGTWTSEHGWFADINANYRAAAYEDVIDQAAHQLKAHAIVNAKAGWRGQRYGAYLTAANIFDKHYADYTYVHDGREQSLLGQPRIVGLTLEAKL